MSRLVDQVGRVLGGRYRLLAPVGTGASGHVFVAEDVTLRRRVAVKVLHEALANDEPFLRRFQAEARAAAALNHPSVMAVYDWGEDGSGPFLVSELLEGGNLRTLLDRGYRLSPSQALLLGLHVAQGLDYAHKRGLVHRDIKPANLLFDAEGRVRIADFGIARALAEAAWTEPIGAVIGSARYASPEQAQGNSLDGRSDVFSLALVLIEAVTGDVPFAADTTIATLMARVGQPLVVPDGLGALAPAVTAAGVQDPAERPDAATFASMLDEAARDLPRPRPLPVGEAVVDPSVSIDRDPTTLVAGPDPTEVDLHMASPTPAPAAVTVPPPVEPARHAERRRRRWPWVVLAAVVALVASAAGVVASGVLLPSHPVPNVEGSTLEVATRRLQALDFDVVVVSRTYEDDTVVGEVVDQQPAARTSLKEGKDVRLRVSLGPTPTDIPDDLVGLTRETVIERLQKLGFAVKEEGRRHEEVDKGRVLEVDGEGSERPRGSDVRVVVSEGPPLRTIPAGLVGERYEDVERALGDLQLVVEREEGYSDDVEVGQVFALSPASGQEVERGSAVKVSVSKGPRTIAVPRVRGMRAEEAVRRLESEGFPVREIRGPFRGRVQATDPTEGSMQERGTPVTLLMG
jgi:eukaryotic-like serine/threonine-protein kinase